MDTKLKAVVVPVSDVDRSRHFYRALGFRLDLDQADGDVRVVQLTPPGSLCSIIIGTGISQAEPGSVVGLLRVDDLEAAVTDLRGRGAAPSPIARSGAGVDCASFRDPDGNQWLLAEDIASTASWFPVARGAARDSPRREVPAYARPSRHEHSTDRNTTELGECAPGEAR